MKTPRDLFWESHDRLRLFARLYDAHDANAPTVLCLPALRRNSRDFHDLAIHLQTRFNVIAPDFRGRGLSSRDRHVTNYQPNVYVRDLLELLAMVGYPLVTVIGTALGGIVGMMLAAAQPATVTGLILNDIGPEVHPAGAARILRLIANRKMPEDWAAASHCIKELYAGAWPDLPPQRWAALARQIFREDIYGRIAIDCDPMVVEVTRQRPASSTDLWPLWEDLGSLPILTLHGALSDVLTSESVSRMMFTHPGMELVTLKNRGHFPLLDEPPALAAIDRFLGKIPRRQEAATPGVVHRPSFRSKRTSR